MKVLILGVNGFIGSHLVARILRTTGWEVYGLDLATYKIQDYLSDPRFHFVEGDVSISKEWIEYHVKKCDVVLPLVAIATPAIYVKDPLRVFELDFEENLRIVRQCVKYKKRVVFPSTSEVYGMCPDDEFDEETSSLVTGPIPMQRWIYSTSKQLMDRVIWAYGFRDGLQFTLFRPFNWIGPKLDSLYAAKEGSSRVVTQFIWNLIQGEPLHLVDGGHQRRCFIYVDDAMDGLMKILENEGGKADGGIFNIGNPKHDYSMRDVAEMLRELWREHPLRKLPVPDVVETSSGKFYGKGYQDVFHRTPSIRRIQETFGFEPKVEMKEGLSRTLDFFLREFQDMEQRPDGD